MSKKVTCLNCGHLQNVEKKDIHIDELGKHTVCKNCDSSFDIE
ncbi:hypothetical protein [Bacillus cereus group sp. TH152-1LC]|nr:hypothetical protein [Bacillus cereus group sp. TH152-1LC]MDA1675404.1 hypothetical protein [Bacillus cereus group sp. TH152-1LC]